ncbi:dimethylamine monooxygenase subunit DmmA family protein [Pseudoclavibacter terrae]|uniref:dimethylamine monooxygenase subunit DmmA family protein n=1 Tax=Pseudoclavibacter terrae TaxID=1530195 RepID=UPI00232E779F|nr:dimethylamine monooxygenase subunit DmmA family protein [Pseudoclavibacter terrae]
MSATATSSARWRRLLEAGGRAATDSWSGSVAPARTMTFLVGAAPTASIRGVPDDSASSGVARGAAVSRSAEPTGDGQPGPGEGALVALDDATSAASRARILEALRVARTGWRFRVVGDELALGALRSVLHDAGVLDEEIEFVLTAPEPGVAEVPVHCGHCQAKTSAPTGGSVPCSGCGLHLTVYPHFSRRQGAYLGYFADAELTEPDVESAAGIRARIVAAERRQSEPVLA